MKNIKIGTKILFGFGIIIFMIAVITLVVSISSSVISNSNELVGIYNEISDAVTQTLNGVNSVRIHEASFTMRYSAEEWDNFVSEYNKTATSGRQATAIISANPKLSEYSSQWNQFMSHLGEYYTSMERVNAAYLQAEIAKDSLVKLGPEIVVAVSTMFDAQMNTTRGQINNLDPPEELNIKMDRINDTVQINNRVTTMRVEVARMAENYTPQRAETVKGNIEAVKEILAEYMAILRTQTSLAIAQTALDKLEEYELAVLNFIYEYELEGAELKNAITIGYQSLQSLNNTTNAIESSLADAIFAAQSASHTAQILVLIVSSIAIAVGLFVAINIKNTITKPILFVSDVASKIANEGSLQFSDEENESMLKYSQGKDETALTVQNFRKLIERLKTIDQCLSMIAANDLTGSIVPLGKQDAMGNALQSMLLTLNEMFGSINVSSLQVSSGSRQVAEGAQALAQGATEQASSIQELASSIADIATSTRENASLANDAAKLAEKIISSAEKGSQQMDDMINAVNEINEASNSIGKVIKVIDDIAFQTNILALNAAVEAARAGQHGKGFAVVAEEVRSLAAKSAEAAKDTGSLIESSMEKALLGVRIAGETAESLSEIVTEIRESNQLVDKIAISSEQQSMGIEQINIGVDQVAQVVSQNSATAQQSAAASQEMSSQSSLLQDLISQFKLIESNSGIKSLYQSSSSFSSDGLAVGSTAGKYQEVSSKSADSTPSDDDFGKY
ncbi:MAG: methyl-accepting chemotaxis protein [Oscillospiraceae bacterium]|nr:methyl-accepting chemotaxis protein [Oscillospiraceae bacterium]